MAIPQLQSSPGATGTLVTTAGTQREVGSQGIRVTIDKVPTGLPYYKRDIEFVFRGVLPANFPPKAYERNQLYSIGPRGISGERGFHMSAVNPAPTNSPDGGYCYLWVDTQPTGGGTRAYLLRDVARATAALASHELLAVNIFNPLQKPDYRALARITGDVEIVGVTPTFFAGYSTVVLRPTKAQGKIIVPPDLSYDAYVRDPYPPNGEYTYTVA